MKTIIIKIRSLDREGFIHQDKQHSHHTVPHVRTQHPVPRHVLRPVPRHALRPFSRPILPPPPRRALHRRADVP